MYSGEKKTLRNQSFLSNNELESLCDIHCLQNKLICLNDNKKICVKCIPLHLQHKIEYISQNVIPSPHSYQKEFNPPQINNNIRGQTIDYNPSEKFPSSQKFVDYLPEPSKAINPDNRYIGYTNNDLSKIQDSYTELREKINTIIDGEINKINSLLLVTPKEQKSSKEELSSKNQPKQPSKISTPYTNPITSKVEGNVPKDKKKPLKATVKNLNEFEEELIPDFITKEDENPEVKQENQEELEQPKEIVKRKEPSLNIGNRIFSSYQEPLMILKLDKDIERTIYLFDLKTFNGRKTILSSEILAPESAIIMCEDKLMISGGKNNKNNIISSCYLVTLISNQYDTISPMNAEKRNHTLAKLDNTIIYSLGGFNANAGYLNICERYIVSENRWEILPPISTGRQDISVCTFRQTFLYSFGGSVFESNSWIYSDVIERLHIVNYLLGWDKIELVVSKGWSPRTFVGVRQITQNEIMIFGGFNSNHLDTVLIFDVKENTIIESSLKLRRSSSFVQRNTCITEDETNIYAIGFPYKDIHRFSFAKKIWEYLEESKWFSEI